MRIVAMAATVLALVALGCGPKGPSAPELKTASLSKGAEVPLILLRQLEAGSTREGTLVPFMVAQDVEGPDGIVVIPKGAVAEGEVSWSRSEGTLSGVLGQPARLEVRILRTRSSGGDSVPLQSDSEDERENFEFNRANTGVPDAKISGGGMQGFDSVELETKALAAIEDFFETGDAQKLNVQDDVREWLYKASEENQMQELRSAMDSGSSDLTRVIRHVRDGSLTQLAGSELLLAVHAVTQLGRLAHSVERSLSSKLKGRTIKAYVGTPAKAFVAKDVRVKVQAGPSR
jgi:hypothetical protein